MTGYAYETIPNRAIITGKTKRQEADDGEQMIRAFGERDHSQTCHLEPTRAGLAGIIHLASREGSGTAQ